MKNIFHQLISDIFYISLITFLIFFVLELIKEGLISNYFDLNLFLIFLILVGLLNLTINKVKI